jgi:Calcium binding
MAIKAQAEQVKAASLRGAISQSSLTLPERSIDYISVGGSRCRCSNDRGMIMGEARKPKKPKPERDDAREERISMEIVVDAYGEEERAISWYYYLEEHLHMPFLARCIEERAVSPIRVGKEVEVLKMAPEDECKREILVSVRWENRSLAVPL